MSVDLLSGPRVKLRPYQDKSVDRIFVELEEKRRKSTLLVLPTGTGKTTVFSEVAKTTIAITGGRVLILAHREELINQAAARLAEHGIRAEIEKAESHARSGIFGESECTVASVATMQGKRLRSWPRGHFKLIVTDEAHHRTATSYCNVIDWLQPDWELGVTATADRGDDEPIVGEGQVYESLAYEYLITEAIKDGWLCPLEAVLVPTDIDLSEVRTTAGDLNAGDVERAISPHIGELAKAAKPHMIGGRSIVFTPDVGSAEMMADALTQIGISSSAISGDTPSEERKRILEGFQYGSYKALVNCALLTEGFDAPFISRVVLMRPTKSRSLHAQMIGRGTRIHPGKESCRIIGFNWKTFKHKLVHPVELVDNYGADAETLDIAKELIDNGQEPDLMRAIERAEGMKTERVKLRCKVREGETRYKRVVRFDPLAVADTLGIPVRQSGERAVGVPATEKQIQTLQKFGVQAKGMGRRQASQYLDAIFNRLRGGFATVKQVSWMIARGVDPAVARGMSKDEATAKLDELFGNRRAV